MAVKYSKHYLNKLEDLLAETSYMLRYERGNFQSGWCILKDTKIIVVNKFFATDGKVNCLLDIIKSIEIDKSRLSDKNQKLYLELSQTKLEI